MISYTKKPLFVSKSMLFLKKRLDKYKGISSKLKFLSQFLYKNTKEMRQFKFGLQQEKKRLADLVFSKSDKPFYIYKKNSIIPFWIMNHFIAIHNGSKYTRVALYKKSIVLTKRFGQFTRTKRTGFHIHRDNKIQKKLKKKMLQRIKMTSQRRHKQKVKSKVKKKSIKKKK